MPTAGSIDRAYLDSSVLRRLYVHDARSMAVAAWRFKHPGPIPLSRFGYAELTNSICLARFRGDLDDGQVQLTLGILGSDIAEGHLTIVEVPWRAVMDQARELSARHSSITGTRTLDVVQVATALELKRSNFVTYDARQASLAIACGLRTLAP